MYTAWRNAEQSEDDGAFVFTVGINLDDTTELNELSSHPLNHYQLLVTDKDTLLNFAPQFSGRIHACTFLFSFGFYDLFYLLHQTVKIEKKTLPQTIKQRVYCYTICYTNQLKNINGVIIVKSEMA